MLEVVVNQKNVGTMMVLQRSGKALALREDELARIIHLVPGTATKFFWANQPYILLDSIADLHYRLIAKTARLEITLPARLLQPQAIDLHRPPSRKVEIPRDNSLFVNYALAANSDLRAPSGFFELGTTLDSFFGTTTVYYDETTTSNQWVRLKTTLRRDERQQQKTIQFGDIEAASAWPGSSAVLGGLAVAKNFELDPYLIRYPALSLAGIADTPSEVAVYVDDHLVYQSKLEPGPFSFDNLPTQSGPLDSTITLTDAFGRQTILSRSDYFSEKILRKGLQEYNYGVGWLRENLGEESFAYGQPLLLAAHRYGFRDDLNLGLSLELSEDIVNSGPLATLLVPGVGGTLDWGPALSLHEGRLGYGSVGAYTRHTDLYFFSCGVTQRADDFRSAVHGTEDPPPTAQYAALGFNLGRFGSISTSLTQARDESADAGASEQLRLSYTKDLSENIFLSTIFTRSEDADQREDAVLVMLYFHPYRHLSAVLSAEAGPEENRTASLRNDPPEGIGFSYQAEISQTPQESEVRGSGEYRRDEAIYSLSYTTDSATARAGVAGGIGLLDRTLFFSRPITDGFAKIKVGELPGVKVYRSGIEMGTTDAAGELIIPDLHSFHENKLSIEALDVPIQYSVSGTTRYISPGYRAGAMVDFGITPIKAYTGRLLVKDGAGVTPVELTVLILQTPDGPREGLVGRGGEFYLENLAPGSYPASFAFAGAQRTFTLKIPEREGVVISLGDIIVP